MFCNINLLGPTREADLAADQIAEGGRVIDQRIVDRAAVRHVKVPVEVATTTIKTMSINVVQVVAGVDRINVLSDVLWVVELTDSELLLSITIGVER